MTITLNRAGATKSRRIRLFFSNNLAVGAFAPSFYTVAARDSSGTDVDVKAVYAISGVPNGCELVLGQDLISGAGYTVTATAVPATDASNGGGAENLFFGEATAPTNVEPVGDGTEVILYGWDVVFNGVDFQENANGDLAFVSGSANAGLALQRRMLGSPLPYAPSYSPDSRQYVDSNDATPLRNRIIQQAFRDDRVAKVSVDVQENTDGFPIFVTTVTLVGGHTPPSVPVTVQN